MASPNLTIGAVIESPTYGSIEDVSRLVVIDIYDTLHSDYYWEWAYEDSGYAEYNLLHPLSFGLGMGFSYRQLNLAVDLKYTDWSQVEFIDEFTNSWNAFIQQDYREVVSVRLGAEYVLPKSGISLRAGYFIDPLPFPSDYISKNRKYTTFGIGFLIEEIMTIDIAAVLGGYTLVNNEQPPCTERYETRIAFVTIAYRI